MIYTEYEYEMLWQEREARRAPDLIRARAARWARQMREGNRALNAWIAKRAKERHDP